MNMAAEFAGARGPACGPGNSNGYDQAFAKRPVMREASNSRARQHREHQRGNLIWVEGSSREHGRFVKSVRRLSAHNRFRLCASAKYASVAARPVRSALFPRHR
jgi:hypothetical protein